MICMFQQHDTAARSYSDKCQAVIGSASPNRAALEREMLLLIALAARERREAEMSCKGCGGCTQGGRQKCSR
jgi:hypothetical protein